jgi:hypothetical protein
LHGMLLGQGGDHIRRTHIVYDRIG